MPASSEHTKSGSVRQRAPNKNHKFSLIRIDRRFAKEVTKGDSVNAKNAHHAARKFASKVKRRWHELHPGRNLLTRGESLEFDVSFSSDGYTQSRGSVYTYTVTIKRKTLEQAMASARVGIGAVTDKNMTIKGRTLPSSMGKPIIDEETGKQVRDTIHILSEYAYSAVQKNATPNVIQHTRSAKKKSPKKAPKRAKEPASDDENNGDDGSDDE